MDAAGASHAGCLLHAAVHGDGGTGLHCDAQAAGARLQRGGLRALRGALPQALHLFLGRAPAAGASLVVGAGEELAVSRFICAHVLGIGTRFAPPKTGSMASVLADLVIPGNLLRGLPRPALPASD